MTVMRRNKGWAFVAWVHDGEGGRRQVWRGGFRTKAEAASAERRFLVELEDGADQRGAEVPSPTVAAFLLEWLEQSAPTRRPTTSVSYERLVRQHIAPHLGTITLAALAPADIRAWHATLLRKPKRWGGAPLSPNTVRTTHRVLRRALQDALRWELIDRNPCDSVIAPRRAEVEMRAWDADQGRTFLAHVEHDRLAAMWQIVRRHRDAPRRGGRAAMDRPRPRCGAPRRALDAGARLHRRAGGRAEDPPFSSCRVPRCRHGRRAAGTPTPTGARALAGRRRLDRQRLRVRARRRSVERDRRREGAAAIRSALDGPRDRSAERASPTGWEREWSQIVTLSRTVVYGL